MCTRFVPPVTHEQERLFQPRPVAGQHLVEVRVDGSSATVSPVQNPEQISGGRVTTTLHTVQDHLQQTTVMTQRRSSKMRSEHTVSKTKGDPAYEALTAALARQEDARCIFDQKCNQRAVAETNFTNAIQDVLRTSLSA